MDGDCSLYREAISALADGEESPVRRPELDRHLLGCSSCSAFAAAVVELTRQAESHLAADPVPDLTADVLVAVDPPAAVRRRRRHRQMRVLLAAAGLVQLVLGVLAFAGVTDHGAHLLRDVGAWQVALAGALLYAAWRPSVAVGLLPMVGLVGLIGIVGAALDIAGGTANPVMELNHLSPLLAAWPLRWLARDGGPDRARSVARA